MARCKLFESWTFKLSLPAPFDAPGSTGPKDFGISAYNSAGSCRKSTLHAPTLRALLTYADLKSAAEAGREAAGKGAIGIQDSTYRLSEYVSSGKTDCAVFNPITGKFLAGSRQDGTERIEPYTLGPGSASGTALLFCLMPLFEKDPEFEDAFGKLRQSASQGWPDMNAATEQALTLCDNVYRRIENASNLGDAGVRISVPATGNVSTLSKLALDSGNYSPSEVQYGEFTVLAPVVRKNSENSKIAESGFEGRYRLSDRELSEKELQMVPKLPEWYIVPEEAVSVCEHIKQTTPSSQPMRNFMFRGEAGTGKTMSAQAIAAGLGLPYAVMTCSANTELSDLIGQFIPDSENRAEPVHELSGQLPKVSDIIVHPPSVYRYLTGVYDETKTEEDVLRQLIETAAGEDKKGNGRGQNIRYVETPLIKAIRYGYLVELQEINCISNPGVLVGLNALLDNCQTVTLPTGEIVKRHPETVIVVTTNTNYAGCRAPNQSMLSRMDLIFDIEAPGLSEMVKRVMNVTGCADEQETTKMALVVRDIADRCRHTMITDGCCGMRELISWVKSAMITKDPYKSALSTVISSASADPENRADLISTCLERQYARAF